MSNVPDSYDFTDILNRIRTKLPIQNPLHSFVHNNILMMFEGKEFHEALSEAGELYRARSYWPLENYKESFKEKKILQKDIQDGIEQYSLHYGDCGVAKRLGLSLQKFYQYLMFSELAFNNEDDIQPEIADQELWGKCAEKMSGQTLKLIVGKKKYRAKEYWEKYYNESVASTTQPYIIRLISSYLDQGQSFWANPYSQKGFWTFFCQDMDVVRNYGAEWQKILAHKLETYTGHSPQQIIENELKRMNIPKESWESYLLEILFDLKGWAGMVNKLELEPWQATVKAPEIKLVDYIATLILIETSLDEYHALNHSTDLAVLYGREEQVTVGSFQLSLALYQITNFFHLPQNWMDKFSASELVSVIQEIEQAEKEHLVRLWHEAYEHHFYREALSAVITHRRTPDKSTTPEAQVLFCIDDREESIRRHLEEINPEVKTFGVVGFFGIDMKFSSVRHQRLIAQCPPVIEASRIVREIPKKNEDAKSFHSLNKFKGGSDLSMYYMSRTLFRGFISTLVLGVASIVPMFLQVFFPKQSKSFREAFNQFISPIPETDITIEETQVGHGYSKSEMANIVAGILDMCGLKTNFSKFVVLVGHGSSSNNNPFKQAYGCGACGGNAGIPNSRAFAKMANNPEVRKILIEKGITIPEETYFVSSFHDTCTDDITFLDLDSMPKKYEQEFQRVKASLTEACKMNALERCQRFSSPESKTNPENAFKHVHERAEDLAQPRPEYGHNMNALAIVGKRDLTKGLFLNRRSFLLTYDWEMDAEGSVLKQIILGGIPVAVNINMDYYFSCVDNDNFGCGSKLPLNLTSLLGVMTGSQGDLRIGLARQMVEIHQPIRNLTIVEAPLERVKKIFDEHPRLKKLLYNHWMRLSVHDPETKQWFLFKENSFQVMEVEKSDMKHFTSSRDLIKNNVSQDNFAEIG